MRRHKVTDPVTDSKEKAQHAIRAEQRTAAPAGTSRAKEDRTGGASEKKRGSAPKQGGRSRY